MLIKKVLLVYIAMLLAMTFFVLPVKRSAVLVTDNSIRTIEGINNYTSNIFNLGQERSDDSKMIIVIAIDYQKYFLFVLVCTLISAMIYLSTNILTAKNTNDEVI